MSETEYLNGYPEGHMWYTEPNKDLLVTYKLAGLCLRCGNDTRISVRGTKTNFCTNCWNTWYKNTVYIGNTSAVDRNFRNNKHYQEYEQWYWT